LALVWVSALLPISTALNIQKIAATDITPRSGAAQDAGGNWRDTTPAPGTV
jgi:hypothetical protein